MPIGSRIGKQIGEDDRRVDAEPLDRDAHHLAAALRIAAELEEAHLRADRAVLRHVAAGLPHQPDGRVVDRLAAAGAEERAVVPGCVERDCGLRIDGLRIWKICRLRVSSAAGLFGGFLDEVAHLRMRRLHVDGQRVRAEHLAGGRADRRDDQIAEAGAQFVDETQVVGQLQQM